MKTKASFILLLMAAMAFCWTACSDKEDIEPNTYDDKSEADHIMTPKQIADYATNNFICHVCKVEIDSTTAKPTSWEVNYGQVLHPETPYVRYTRAESLEDARKEFLSMICMEAAIDSSSIIGAMKVPMGSHGSVKYNPVNDNGEWARIEVNLKELPDLQTIVFCKPEAWPENDSDIGVKRCMVFVRSEGGHDVYYICVKECGTPPGYLIGFDTWTINGTYSNHTYRDRNCYDHWWWNRPGGASLIDHLRGVLYNGDGTEYRSDLIHKICQYQGGHSSNKDKCGDEPLYNFLYSKGKLAGRKPYFKTGDDHAWIDTHDPFLYKGQWHWIRTPYTVMEPSKVYWSKIAYECDEIDPNTHNGSNTHTCNVEQGDNWGVAWCCFQFGAEWIWKVGEWYSFQDPYIIEFSSKDAKDLKGFMTHFGLRKANF